jgi:hypothetical protein
MPYLDEDGLVECGHGDESFCEVCGGCLDCSNCYCEEDDPALSEPDDVGFLVKPIGGTE